VQTAAGFAQPVSVTVAYDLNSNALVSMMKNTFTNLGLNTSFPTTLSATQIASSE